VGEATKQPMIGCCDDDDDGGAFSGSITTNDTQHFSRLLTCLL
jgi:hypothetical protein